TQTSKQGPWTDVYALAGVFYFAVTGKSPPDAITRMKEDAVAQTIGVARMRYSGPFVDAIAWGLAMDDAARPRTVVALRDALFGGKAVPAVASAPARASSSTVRVAPVAAPAAAAPNAEARAAALAVLAMQRHADTEARRRVPWVWAGFGIVVVIVLFFG